MSLDNILFECFQQSVLGRRTNVLIPNDSQTTKHFNHPRPIKSALFATNVSSPTCQTDTRRPSEGLRKSLLSNRGKVHLLALPLSGGFPWHCYNDVLDDETSTGLVRFSRSRVTQLRCTSAMPRDSSPRGGSPRFRVRAKL